MPLTAKQKDFVQYYEDIASETRHNGKQAYIRAYPGCTENTAEVESCKSLRKPKIKQAIAEYGQEVAEKVDVKREEIVQALRKLAGLDAGAGKVENRDKLSSLKLLGQTLVMFADKTIHSQEPAAVLTPDEQVASDKICESIKLSAS